MILLGLDLGEKRIGIAKSDELGMMAHALPFLLVKTKSNLVEILKPIFSEWNPTKVIVGHPLTLQGGKSKQTQKIEGQVEILRQSFPELGFELWDERLTTKEAEGYLRESGVSGSKRRQKVDSLSAQILLQHYLDAKKSKE